MCVNVNSCICNIILSNCISGNYQLNYKLSEVSQDIKYIISTKEAIILTDLAIISAYSLEILNNYNSEMLSQHYNTNFIC